MVNFCSRKNILSFHFLFFLFYLFSLLLSGSQISAEFFGFLEKCSAPYFRCFHRFNLTAEKGFKRIVVTSPSLFSSQSISNSTELKNRDLLAANPANSIIVQTAYTPERGSCTTGFDYSILYPAYATKHNERLRCSGETIANYATY
jgi:hypothetical protein